MDIAESVQHSLGAGKGTLEPSQFLRSSAASSSFRKSGRDSDVRLEHNSLGRERTAFPEPGRPLKKGCSAQQFTTAASAHPIRRRSLSIRRSFLFQPRGFPVGVTDDGGIPGKLAALVSPPGRDREEREGRLFSKVSISHCTGKKGGKEEESFCASLRKGA